MVVIEYEKVSVSIIGTETFPFLIVRVTHAATWGLVCFPFVQSCGLTPLCQGMPKNL